MTTLTEWLLAQIAEDEAVVECIETVTYRDRWFTHPSGEVNHISPHGLLLHGRRRLLAEVDAKRRIVIEMSERAEYEGGGYDIAMGDLLPLLALPYADRPGYREEWKP